MSKKHLSDSEFNDYFKNQGKKRKKQLIKHRKTFAIISLSLFGAFIAFLIYIVAGLPSLEELENPSPQLASKVFGINGELVGQFFIENRIETNLDSLPRHLVDALIATEDRKFYAHWGVDMERFIKAMFKNVFYFSREGASTITQQLAKNLYSLKAGRENSFDTAVRKIREWMTALQIEKTYTKHEILELYLNVSYFGRSAYGIETASKVYFNKNARDLSLPESALFVALLKSPEQYDPVRRKDNALQRRNLVMYNMVQTGLLQSDQYKTLREEPIALATERMGGVPSLAPHFMEYVRKYLESLSEKYGYNLYRDGLNIYTSIDLRMQRIANQSASEHIKEYQELFDKNWKWERNKDLLTAVLDRAIKNTHLYRTASTTEEKASVYNKLKNHTPFVDSVKKAEQSIEVGFVVLDPHNGHIKAMVGGRNQEFGRGLNHVTGIRRQPGSSFKPLVYATAVTNGYYPAHTVLNQPFNHNGWSPKNANDEYSGYMTLRRALANSVNVVAGRMTIGNMAPPSQVIQIAKKMGIKSRLDPYPAIALGTSDLSPLEMTSAFSTFANNGVHIEPIAVLKIEDKNGILIDTFIPEYTEAISPETASIITDMMQDIVSYGTGAGVRRYFHRPAAGKTGTTQNFSDAWFVGFTPQLVAGVWVGFDDHRVKFTNWYGQGAKAAMPIWGKFMKGVYEELDLELKYFELAPDVQRKEFCEESMSMGEARLASANCYSTVTDLVSKNNLPPICTIHSGGSSGGRIREDDRRGDTGW
jgi:penicillin-binding protein 1A